MELRMLDIDMQGIRTKFKIAAKGVKIAWMSGN